VYRCGEDYASLRGVEALVVDDGIVAGSTMTATTRFLKKLSAERVVVAAPTRHYVLL
jgi:predicted phosphoribosyltransferase